MDTYCEIHDLVYDKAKGCPECKDDIEKESLGL
jgi:hypothetical protein